MIQHRDWSGAETAQAPVIADDPDALVACPEGSPTSKFVRGLGARTVHLPFRSLRHSGGALETVRSLFRGLRSAFELRRILHRNPDREVVFAIGLRPGLLASLAALGMRRRVVWSFADLLPPHPLRWPVRLVASYGSARLIPTSHYIASDLVGRSRRLSRRVSVVHPGLDPDRFDPGRATPGSRRAAIVGHISVVKRTDLAVDVAARVLRDEPDFELAVVGEAQFRDEDRELERRLRARVESDPALRDAVEFRGRVSDVAGVLAGCGLLLHARHDEPYGMVLLEAMAQGLPVVAPASGGPLEIVEDGVTGLLYRPRDPAQAAECVLRLIRDPELAARMGEAGRRRVETNFLSASQVQATRALLQPGAEAVEGSGALVGR